MIFKSFIENLKMVTSYVEEKQQLICSMIYVIILESVTLPCASLSHAIFTMCFTKPSYLS